MRFVIGKTAKEFQIFDDGGNDITDQIKVKRFKLETQPGQPTIAHLEVFVDQVEIKPLEVRLDNVGWYPEDPDAAQH